MKKRSKPTSNQPISSQLELPAAGARRSKHDVHYSSQSVEWPTPQWLFDALAAEFAFTLDPCSTHENAKCLKHYTRTEDGLRQNWQDEIVFMNPPYGRVISSWMQKAYESARAGALVVALVPARTDCRWWHAWAMRGEIRLIKGRVKFEGATNGAPFPSAIVIFRPPGFALKSANLGNSPNVQNQN